MTTIKLVKIDGINSTTLDNVTKPTAGPQDVVIQVALCGICGSDLGYIAMGGLLEPGNPMALGHELSGVVVETGDEVKHLQLGDRVVVNPEGNANRIGNGGPEGAFSPYLLVRGAATDPATVLKLPDSLSMEQGAMVEPLSVAMHAVNSSQIGKDDKAVIFGAGTIGLCIALILGYRGLRNVIVVDLSTQRLRVAEKLGAATVLGNTASLPDFLIQQHGQSADNDLPNSPASDVYFEATGVDTVFNQTTQLAQRGARIVVVGVHKKAVSLDLVNLLFRELKIIGSMAYPTEFPEVITMLASGKVDISALITHRFPLSKFDDALKNARDTSKAIKVLIDCQG